MHKQFPLAIRFVIIVTLGLVAPLLLMPVVKITGYSEVLEEVSKALVILFLISYLGSSKEKLLLAIVFGLFFGLSESMFYFNNILQLGDFGIIWQRFAFTIPMHIFTTLLIAISALKYRPLIIIGLMISVLIHLLFNIFI